MSATAKRSVTERELQDWRVWAIGGGATLALGYQAVQHLGWRAALAAPPVAVAGAASTWAWLRTRPTGFAAGATRALVAQMPDGSRPPRLVSCRQEGEVWEMAWKPRDIAAAVTLPAKTEVLEHTLQAALRIWLEDGLLHMRAGTGSLPKLVPFQDFYQRHQEAEGELVFGLGESRWGPIWVDLTKLPHLLVAGTTRYGKSVALRQILTRLVTRYSPRYLKLALFDLKRVELGLFRDLPHVAPPPGQAPGFSVARDLASCLELLRVLTDALNERSLKFELAEVGDIEEWNARASEAERLPYVVAVIDELGELRLDKAPSDEAGREERRQREEAQTLISGLGSQGRAFGFHLIAATQRPDMETVPGSIKSHLPARVAFNVASGTESRIMLGEQNSAAAKLPPRPGRGIWQWEEPVVFQGVLLEHPEAARLLAKVAGR
jgi:hypothetical protein